MALTQLSPPFPIFTDRTGRPLDGGYLYFGEVDQDPETAPITVYFDSALTQPAVQPLRTSAGYVMRDNAPALLYAASRFSVTVKDKQERLVVYAPSTFGLFDETGLLFAENNLSDVDNADTAIQNIGGANLLGLKGLTTTGLINRTGAGTFATVPLASKPQAEAGTNNDTYMSPLRTAEAIAALGNAQELIEYRAVSGSPVNLDFFWDDTNYTSITLEVANLTPTGVASRALSVRLSSDGTTFETGGSSYRDHRSYSQAGTMVASDTTGSAFLPFGANNVQAPSAFTVLGVSGDLTIKSVDTNSRTSLTFDLIASGNAGALKAYGGGWLEATGVCRGVRFFFDGGGSFSNTGSVTVIGTRKP